MDMDFTKFVKEIFKLSKGKVKKRKEHVIYMTGKISDDEGLGAACTCGKWSYGPSKSLPKIGNAANKHAQETGHKLRSH